MSSVYLLSERIRQVRIEQHLTQSMLAEMANISNNYLGQIERGIRCPTLETIFKISDALSISPVTLLNDVDNMPITFYTLEMNKIINLLAPLKCDELDQIYEVLDNIIRFRNVV